jgi:Big-like domain-containing protein
MNRGLARTVIATSIALAFIGTAQAALDRMGPISTASSIGGYPTWFQDKSGLALEFCDPKNQAELNGGWCTLIPPNPSTAPETFPTSFFVEHFYFNGSSVITGGTTKAKLVTAVEAAFANGTQVIPGDQVTFGRIRVDITPAPYSGTYTVYHPFGKWIFPNVPAGGRIRFTQDIGLACVGTFTCTLNTDIGPFLLPSPTPGGGEVGAIPDIQPGQDPYYDILVNTGATTPSAGTGKKYIADPARIGPVTGSPLPSFVGSDGVTYNHNVFRVEGPNGFVMHTQDFTLNGRIMTGPMAGQVTGDRASYSQTVAASPTGKKLDVFATGNPGTQGRLPTQPTPSAVPPQLSFFDAPCVGTLNPVTDLLMPPYSAPQGATQYQMVNTGNKFWAQAQPSAIPVQVCLEDASARDANGNAAPVFYLMNVTDEVAITTSTTSGATFDPTNGGTLTVHATSSDTLTPPILTLAGYGPMTNGAITVTPLAAPPAKVTVLSAEGGTADLIVTTGVGSATTVATPFAANDTATMFEDCSATSASSCASPLVISPLANDTVSGGPIPAGAVVSIAQQPRLGTAVVNANNTITYTPNPNVNGSDSIAYSVMLNGAFSNTATILINITPVNDPPVAVDDTIGGRVGLANSFNVIANDTDVDGATDLANAQIVSWPTQLGPQPVPTNGVVNFTPAATGTYTFTYKAVDKSGATSANTANVTVTVAVGEAITVAQSLFRSTKTGGTTSVRWTVQGVDSIKQGQVLTIVYNEGTLTSAAGGGSCNGTATNPKCVVGTALVDQFGNYLYDQVGSPGGAHDPTDTATWAVKPTNVKVFSSSPVLGGSQTSLITFK